MPSKKTVVVHPPESKLKSCIGFLKGVLKIVNVLMFALKVVNKIWDALQKFSELF